MDNLGSDMQDIAGPISLSWKSISASMGYVVGTQDIGHSQSIGWKPGVVSSMLETTTTMSETAICNLERMSTKM